MKMTSGGCCVLMYDHSGEPVVHTNEPGLPRTDVSDVGAPNSESEAERKKSRTERAPKSPLTAVLESWLLSILHCGFSVILLAHSLFISRWCRNDSGSVRNWRSVDWRGDWWAMRGRHIVVTRRLVPLARGPQHDVLRLSTVEVGAGI